MVLLLGAAGCADFALEEQEFCQRNPERCGGPPGGDGGSDAGVDAGTDAGVDAGMDTCGNRLVEPGLGEVCDDGNRLSGDGCSEDCRSTEVCGNGQRDVARGEACDDGNTVTETECPYGSPSCIRCNADCSATRALTGRYCGDTLISNEEGCDDGNSNNEDNCSNACRRNVCGDGVIDRAEPGVEACDDGNTRTEFECPYGMASCNACNANCSGVLSLTGPYCGDGIKNGAEACDDGNTVSENACTYGTASCTACDATCQNPLSLQGPYCGDGLKNGAEVCDDGNTSACGTCNASCSGTQSAHATGMLTIGFGTVASLDRDTFSIHDGIHPTVVFEFDTNGSVGAGRVLVDISSADTSSAISSAIAAAINNAPTLDVTATASSNVVNLRNDSSGSFGNRTVVSTASASELSLKGMSGGAGTDCTSGTGCRQDADCAPGLVCVPGENVCGVP
jgi:cysteine-rich repeat protein